MYKSLAASQQQTVIPGGTASTVGGTSGTTGSNGTTGGTTGAPGTTGSGAGVLSTPSTISLLAVVAAAFLF